MAIQTLTASTGIVNTRPYPALYPGYGTTGTTGFSVCSWAYRLGGVGSDPALIMLGAVGVSPTAGDNFFLGGRGTSSMTYFIAKRWGTTQGQWEWPLFVLNRLDFICVTYDYSSTANVPSCYINGIPQTLNATLATPAGTLSAAPAQTAFVRSAGNGTVARFVGAVSHQAIWRRELSAAEVKEIYRSGPLVSAKNLVFYLPFDLQRFPFGMNLAPGYESIGKAYNSNGIVDCGGDPYGGRYVGSPLLARRNYVRRSAIKLGITTQPATAVDGVAFVTQPVIQLQDTDGSSILDSGRTVTAAITSGTGVLSGTTGIASDASGVVTFTNLKITGTGAHTLTFTEPTLTGIASASFTVAAASVTASELRVTTQPVNTVVGATMASIIVKATDAAGVTSVAYVTNVVLTFQTNPPTAPSPAGTLTRACVAGVATFNDIVISTLATGYQFHFTSGAITAANSSTFNITVPASGGGSFFGGGVVHLEG